MKKAKIVFGFLSLLLIGCTPKKNQLKSDIALTKKIEKQFELNDEIIEFQKLTNFEWDHVIIFEPYSSIKKNGIEWSLNLSNIQENRIKSDDGINLIVFLKDNKCIKILEPSRQIGDFKNLQIPIPKQNAKFFKTKNRIELVRDNSSKYYFYRDITQFSNFKDFNEMRGMVLNHQKNPNSNKGLQHIRKDSLHILILEKIIKVAPRRVAYELLDTVHLIDTISKYDLQLGYCKSINEKDEEKIIFGFGKNSKTEYLDNLVKVWRIDLIKNRFIKLNKNDFKCFNEEYENGN
ncbi:hypothetical protein [Aquimarina sp. Aq78]|uniref:hypothetical protein n=1 Tax=Aquimarina sp. Aq78 TaxID=1191889 RepID=UPI000D0F864D|nr:hypothetical protein [Aquimarina sp. Aq78]